MERKQEAMTQKNWHGDSYENKTAVQKDNSDRNQKQDFLFENTTDPLW